MLKKTWFQKEDFTMKCHSDMKTVVQLWLSDNGGVQQILLLLHGYNKWHVLLNLGSQGIILVLPQWAFIAFPLFFVSICLIDFISMVFSYVSRNEKQTYKMKSNYFFENLAASAWLITLNLCLLRVSTSFIMSKDKRWNTPKQECLYLSAVMCP